MDRAQVVSDPPISRPLELFATQYHKEHFSGVLERVGIDNLRGLYDSCSYWSLCTRMLLGDDAYRLFIDTSKPSSTLTRLVYAMDECLLNFTTAFERNNRPSLLDWFARWNSRSSLIPDAVVTELRNALETEKILDFRPQPPLAASVIPFDPNDPFSMPFGVPAEAIDPDVAKVQDCVVNNKAKQVRWMVIDDERLPGSSPPRILSSQLAVAPPIIRRNRLPAFSNGGNDDWIFTEMN